LFNHDLIIKFNVAYLEKQKPSGGFIDLRISMRLQLDNALFYEL
jgi:hypothetical protein